MQLFEDDNNSEEGWTRTIRATDMKFQWTRFDTDGNVDKHRRFDMDRSAYVRKLDWETDDDWMWKGRVSLVTPDLSAVDSKIKSANGTDLVTFQDIATAQNKSYEDKIQWFQDTCAQLNDGHVRMNVRREYLLRDSMEAVMSLSRKDLRKVWRFEFIGEAGIDAAREWFELVTEEVFDPDMGLWQTSATQVVPPAAIQWQWGSEEEQGQGGVLQEEEQAVVRNSFDVETPSNMDSNNSSMHVQPSSSHNDSDDNRDSTARLAEELESLGDGGLDAIARAIAAACQGNPELKEAIAKQCFKAGDSFVPSTTEMSLDERTVNSELTDPTFISVDTTNMGMEAQLALQRPQPINEVGRKYTGTLVAIYEGAETQSTTSSNQMCMEINPASEIVCPDDHLIYFRFIGRVMGKAMFDRQLVKGHMVKHLYKHILGWPIMFNDLKDIDEEYYNSLKGLMDMGADVEHCCIDFTVMEDTLGVKRTVELVPNGANIDVTEENLPEYIEACLKYRLFGRYEAQLNELLLGFFEVIPEPLLTIFDFQELELLMCEG